MKKITVVGAGFAGVEAAWASATRGVPVRLFEMRPKKSTPAHTTPYFGELVCSNSLKSDAPISPAGQLKYEMRGLGSVVLEEASTHAVPGGQALCVDREKFSESLTKRLESHPLIEVVREEWLPSMAAENLANGPLILATGPLSTDPVSEWLAQITGREHLYFYDAVSPTVDASSLDRSIVFEQSRYEKGEEAAYLNCPFNREEYEAFVRELVSAERAPLHAFEAGGRRDGDTISDQEAFVEKVQYFAGCMPIEVIAERGARSLAFGNFKPVGLTDPRTGRRPFAALQLRPENREKTLYTLVACQNRLRFGEQKRVFQMVPGLSAAEFIRYGVIHRNTYLEAPRCLSSELELADCPGIFIAGQLTGVEGYVESAAMGALAGVIAALRVRNLSTSLPPRETAYGCLLAHLQDQTPRDFAPMNINWGLFPVPDPTPKDKGVKHQIQIERAQRAFTDWVSSLD